MSFSLVRPLLGFRPAIVRSTCLDSTQFLRYHPLSTTIRRQSPLLTRTNVPQTKVLGRLGITRTGQRLLPGLLTATGIAGIVLGISACTAPTIHCDSQGTIDELL
jgi:FUN14 domain-containing protein 1